MCSCLELKRWSAIEVWKFRRFFFGPYKLRSPPYMVAREHSKNDREHSKKDREHRERVGLFGVGKMFRSRLDPPVVLRVLRSCVPALPQSPPHSI